MARNPHGLLQRDDSILPERNRGGEGFQIRW
jgi:hypothetical protein